MESENSGGGLDDLRKKRLAYFQTSNKPDTFSQHNPNSVNGQLATNDSKPETFAAVKIDTATAISENNHAMNGYDIKTLSSGNVSSVNEKTDTNKILISTVVDQKHVEHSAIPLKTSAFYFANPEQPKAEQSSLKPAALHSLPAKMNDTSYMFQKQESDGLDAYNETVERLIRATKEELLGQKSSDDIWKKFTKDCGKEGNEQQTRSRNIGDQLNTGSVTPEKLVERSGNRALEEVSPVKFDSSLRQREVSENLIKDANENVLKPTDHELEQSRTQNTLFTNYESRPLYSSGEPTQKFHSVQKEEQKSYTTSKVEEIFSSRQITQSQLPKSVSFMDSHEFEPIQEVTGESIQQSLDLSELGLSTHRPESDRQDDLKGVSDEINLGDTVTKELRTVLGEEKFQEFLMKAKRDIADLHQENSSRKDKTPRLMKDKQAKSKPDTPKSKPDLTNKSKDFESEKPKSILKNKESIQKEDTPMMENETVNSGNKPLVTRQRTLSDSKSVRNSMQDFTPRQSDGDAIENMIGEYLLDKPGKVESEDHFVDRSPDDKPVTIPKLDLAGVIKPEISRPKLNRPKNVPPNIYQDKQQENDQKETDREMRHSADKNYDQVTVPRNVAFSADEIYNQAYKGMHPNQQNVSNGHYMAGQGFYQGPVHQGPFVSSTGAASMMPITPTTPVSHVSMSVPYNQPQNYPNSPGFLNYSGDMSSLRGNFLRQSSHTSVVSENIPTPHPPNQTGLPQQMAFNPIYPNYTEHRHYNVPLDPRHGVPAMPSDQPIFVPHPPSNPSTPGHMNVSASHGGPIGIPENNAYQYPMMMMSPSSAPTGGQQFFYPQPPPLPPNMGIQVGHPHQMTSSGAQLYDSQQMSHSESGKTIEVKADVHHPPVTPSMSNAEVQTDREGDSHEKATLVEESTFTSVSQLPDNDKFVPHPPAGKKDGRPSPRWHHKAVQDSKRHIDGIRQHHEQRRKEHEEEKLTDDQIIANQKRYAKASIDRYFSSLENVYQSSTNAGTSKLSNEDELQEVDDENESEVPGNMANNLSEKSVDVVDDVMSNVVISVNQVHGQESEKIEVKDMIVENPPKLSRNYEILETNKELRSNDFDVADVKGEVTLDNKRDVIDIDTKENGDFKIHEFRDGINAEDKELDNEKDNDSETLVGSMVNTDVTIQGGGLTDRLKDLGIDVSHRQTKEVVSGKNKKNIKKKGDKKADKKGKVLIVCPECQGLNKQYMSWCTQCGEMIIGVEPMLVSKNRDGKIRTKPLNKDEDKLVDDIRIQDSVAISKEIVIDRYSEPVEVNYVQHVDEKPFTLNLDTIKSDKDEPDELLLTESKKCSPIKSDGKDSGRPSSDDPDLEIQTQKIEEEVVNDICAAIADPVLKGYVKSHFNKSKNTAEDFKEQTNKSIGIEKGFESDKKLNNAPEAKSMKSFHHDIVDMNHETKVMENIHKLSCAIDDDIDKRKVGNSWLDNDYIAQVNENAQVSVSSKIDMFETKHSHGSKNNTVDKEQSWLNKRDIFQLHEPEIFESPPPIPNFSATVPALHNELSLKLPANSMDYSTDMSQVIYQKEFHAPVEKGDTIEDKKRREIEERRKERRRKRGHGAIDVEVFGYEESRESRNSSRANRMVPMLNLGGNSSDEDDSAHSEFKPFKPEQKQPGSKFITKSSLNAWEPATVPEENEYPVEKPVEEEYQSVREENTIQIDQSENKLAAASLVGNEFPGQTEPSERPNDLMVTSDVDESARLEPSTSQDKTQDKDESWKKMFDPVTDQQQNQDEPLEIPEDVEESVVDDSQPFLMQIINQSKPKKSMQRPQSAGGKPVKSKVRQSIEEPGYQRKWTRSSTAWNSYNPGELNTSSSLRSSADLSKSRASSLPRSRATTSSDNKASPRQDSLGGFSTESLSVRRSTERNRRPVSAPKSRTLGSDMQASVALDEDKDLGASQQPRPGSAMQSRPFSVDLQKRKGTKKKNAKSGKLHDSFDLDLDLIEHRLPKPSMIDRLNELMLSPKSTYDRLIEMTPRIQAGTVSKWQCLPDEILIHIFAYLDQTSLTKCAQVCQRFYRVAMDESLWKYITIKKSDIDDSCLEEIAKRHPVSLALIQCYGDQVTAKGLRDLFKDCANSLKELNVARCSRGALNGDSLMLHAAARCHNLTYVDASWCALTDSGLMAISNCCHRIESLCINGCNAVSNDGLETTIKKHGTSLRVLEMFGCFNLSPRGLRSVANNCINLISLNLGQCYKLTDSCISQLSTSLGRVETLDLRGCKQIKDNCIRRIVKNCPRLKHLSLANCPSITDVSVLEISTYLTDIRSIDLCGCKSVTDGSIRALVNTCTNLRNIDISSTSCTHRSVSMIANFSGQRLETLKINFLSDITEQSLIKLAKHCHRLKSVHLYGCTSVRNLSKVKEERPNFAIEM